MKREKLASLGVQVGRWTHSGKFRFGIGVLDILAQYAKYKVRVPMLACSVLYLCPKLLHTVLQNTARVPDDDPKIGRA